MHCFSPTFTNAEFQQYALQLFQYQYDNNNVYQEFCRGVGGTKETVNCIEEIPFLPIELFKTHKIVSGNWTEETLFLSSGTTGMVQSKHYVKELSRYEQSCLAGFRHFYGDPHDWVFLALLPSYMERKGSSLINMVELLMRESGSEQSGWFLNDYNHLFNSILRLESEGRKALLIGVTYALLDFAEQFPLPLRSTIVMETGGMKGRRQELTKAEVHHYLCQQFQTQSIHSEYGMAELFSQAYAYRAGIFNTPPWMQVLIRDAEDPLSLVEDGKTGGINIIDLANRDSCAFIATQDLGRKHADGSFEILGRFDYSDVRGCNLLVAK